MVFAATVAAVPCDILSASGCIKVAAMRPDPCPDPADVKPPLTGPEPVLLRRQFATDKASGNLVLLRSGSFVSPSPFAGVYNVRKAKYS